MANIFYNAREPVSEEVMNECRFTLPGSICHILARIYRSTKDEKVKLDIRLATAKAKAMHTKLKEYHEDKHNRLRP